MNESLLFSRISASPSTQSCLACPPICPCAKVANHPLALDGPPGVRVNVAEKRNKLNKRHTFVPCLSYLRVFYCRLLKKYIMIICLHGHGGTDHHGSASGELSFTALVTVSGSYPPKRTLGTAWQVPLRLRRSAQAPHHRYHCYH